MSDILGKIAEAALKNMMQGGQAPAGGRGAMPDSNQLADALRQILTGGGGGQARGSAQSGQGGVGELSDLLQQFQQQGGDTPVGKPADPWGGSGGQKAPEGGGLAGAFPPGLLSQWAGQLGVDSGSLLAVLTQAAPYLAGQAGVAAQNTPESGPPGLDDILGGLLGGRR